MQVLLSCGCVLMPFLLVFILESIVKSNDHNRGERVNEYHSHGRWGCNYRDVQRAAAGAAEEMPLTQLRRLRVCAWTTHFRHIPGTSGWVTRRQTFYNK